MIGRVPPAIAAFAARRMFVGELPELATFVVVLAEDEDGGGDRLELQRAFAFDEQDRRLGHDTYCVCTEDGATSYGGVSGWSLASGRLAIRFDDTAAAVFGARGFAIAVAAADHAELVAGLARVLGLAGARSSA